MCCFAKPVKVVTNTNLFARLTKSGTQMLAYQMEYSSEELNAMILPIPAKIPAREKAVRFVSLKEYGDFFEDLDRGFPSITPQAASRSLGAVESKAAPGNLVVHEVGDFVASFVPSMKDFSRLDQQFVIPKSSWDKIPVYNDYGFLVFQLKNLSGRPHPMAFEFESRLKDKIFFPTVHIHDGEVHQREKFDHTLYLQNDRFDEVCSKRYSNSHVKDKKTQQTRSKSVAKDFVDIDKAAGLVKPDLLVHRRRMIGRFENKDVITSITPPGKKLFGFLDANAKSSVPLAVGAAGLGWMIKRRNEIASNE